MEERIVAWDRECTDMCQKSTPGCCIDHTAEAEAGIVGDDSGCECW